MAFGTTSDHPDIPGVVVHEVHEEHTLWMTGDLFTVKCDGCGNEWPCTKLAWSKFSDPEDVSWSCNVPGCTGSVRWDNWKEWRRDVPQTD